VNISVPNLRLFIGNIPKSKGKEDIMEEFGKITSNSLQVNNFFYVILNYNIYSRWTHRSHNL